MKFSIAAAVAVASLVVSGCSGSSGIGGAQSTSPGATASMRGGSFGAQLRHIAATQHIAINAPDLGADAMTPDETAAANYCVKTGGTVYMRIPEYDTNGSNPLVLAGRAPFCQYTAGTSGGSRIHILLTTLYSKKPSLAALAYILKPPSGSCNGNPGSCYCTLLGGSDQFGGDSGAGGSWVNLKSTDQDLEACIFPDMSSIDSWGLLYNTNGVTRGIDLTTVMRYKFTGN